MFFTEKNRKKNLIVFFLALPLFCGAVFLTQTHIACAANVITEAAGNAFDLVFKGILLGIFTMIGWMASVAITLFEWVIKPENISGTMPGSIGVLNLPAVYEMWKFIRDFFNLFFILVLLYVAFKIVFQIEHDFKKTLLSIVLAALFINFSFPVTRVLIDVTNVPMYFFANQMASTNGGGTDVFGQAMSASRIKGILIPGAENGGSVVLLDPKNTYGRFLIAIVFMFLFSVTLLVLAVMFVVRLVALVVLVIFSPVGFAASIVPGLSSYSKMWWENFWKYAFFGPAAMLMLLVSVRFFSALGDEKTGIFKGVVAVANTNVSSDSTFFASMALFSVPIIMLWMAMSLAQTFSIAGASSVVGQGKKFSSWAGNKTLNGGKWLAYKNPIGRGLYGGGKKVGMEGKIGGFDYGKKLPGGKFLTGDYWASPSKTEATIKGGIAGGWGGGAKARKKLDQQAVIDRVKKDKENQVSNSTHRDNLKNSKNPIEREAAALALANDKEIRTAEELSQAMDALRNNTDGLVKVIEGAKSSAFENMDAATYKEVRDVHFEKDQKGDVIRDPVTHQATTIDGMNKSLEALDYRVVKEGNANVLVDYQVNNTGVSRESAVNTVLVDIKSAKEKVKQESLFTDPRNVTGVNNYVSTLKPLVRQELEKSAAQESPNVHTVLSGIPRGGALDGFDHGAGI